jgi:hypothetical protein
MLTTKRIVGRLLAFALLLGVSTATISVTTASKAYAGGYATVYHDAGAGYMVQVCRIATAYGYVLRTVANKPSYSLNMFLQTFIRTTPEKIPGNQIGGASSHTWWANSVMVLDTAAGSANNWYEIVFNGGGQYRTTGLLPLAWTPDC